MSVPEPVVQFLQIALINVLLSGDNALVIAMAAGHLPPRLRGKAVRWGIAGAVLLRIAMALAAVRLLRLPLLQASGGLLLVGIAVRLAAESAPRHGMKSGGTMRAAGLSILLADFVMSLDNVLAVAALSRGNPALMAAGIALSVPLIPWGSSVMMRILRRFPVLVHAGAAILGYAAGDMVASDRLVGPWLSGLWRKADAVAPFAGASAVLAIGLIRHLAAQARSGGGKRP